MHATTGYYQTFVIDRKGVVWAFGVGMFGHLGLGNTETVFTPTRVKNIPKITRVSSSSNHTLFLDGTGHVWGSGSNYCGELGLGDFVDRNQPERSKFFSEVKDITTGLGFSLILDKHGRVWILGFKRTKKPIRLTGLPEIIDISASHRHFLLLDIHGNVWSGGSNKYGELGLGFNTGNRRIQPRRLKRLQSKSIYKPKNIIPVGVLRIRGPQSELICEPKNAIPFRVLRIKGLFNIKRISTGDNYSLALDENGSVWAFGSNCYGQLGIGNRDNQNSPIKIERFVNGEASEIPKIKEISAGSRHALLLDTNNKVWGFGENDDCQLGLGDRIPKCSRLLVPHQIKMPAAIKAISAGGFHSIVLGKNDELWSFGWNIYGELGLGKENIRHVNTPTRIVSDS